MEAANVTTETQRRSDAGSADQPRLPPLKGILVVGPDPKSQAPTPPPRRPRDLLDRAHRAAAVGEVTTPQARELLRLSLEVCELELELAALRGRLDARQPGTFAAVAGDGRRPGWDQYFLLIADAVALRSPDPAVQHGCVLVDAARRIISTGYNGPIHGVDDEHVPLERPAKYNWIIHAEDNAVLFAHRDLTGCTAYVTGFPCAACLRRLLQAGIVRIVCGPRWSQCISTDEREAGLAMAAQRGVRIDTAAPDPSTEFARGAGGI